VRAARIHRIGGIPQVDEVVDPGDPGALDVTASALNPVDISIANGRYYGGAPEPPFPTGSEAVGTTADGRRLWYYGRGVMAERVAPLDPARAAEIPDGIDDATALACGVAGLTGWLAVAWRAQVTPEDTVLVLGASGTLGATVVQAAKLLGAARVIGAARRVEGVPDAADEVVRLEGDYTLPKATLIVDGLWGEPVERALAAAADDVRLVQLGQSASATAQIQSAWIRGKATHILGHALGSTPPDVRAAGYRALCEHARAGRIVFETATYPLDRIAEAWERQASGSPGVKIVIDLSG
jgi:NADPH:quinone reductase-like Zn-dependent oxidoreductase